ncbi:MAG: DUF4340 domain-containing protein [Desulfomonilaceae bacterium]
MKSYKLLIYLGVLVALLAYIYFVEIRHKQAQSEREEKAARIMQLDKDKIEAIKISDLHGLNLEIKKSAPGNWNIISPINASADERVVRNLLTSATMAKPERVVLEKDVKWADYGLEKPDLKVEFVAPGKSVTLSFGASNPSKSSFYLKTDEDPRLFLVPDTLKISLNKGLFDLRDKSISKISPDKIKKIQVVRNGQEVDLEKNDGKWRMIMPNNVPAKSTKINSLLREISDLRAKEIIDSPSSGKNPYDLEKSKNKIIVDGDNGSTTFTFGAAKGQKSESGASTDLRYVSVSGQAPVYVVDDTFFTGAKLDPDSLADRSIVQVEPLVVEKILIQFNGENWELAKKIDNKWKMEEPRHLDRVDDWRISEILWSLKDITYKSMITPIPDNLAPYGLNSPGLVISIYQKASTKPVKITMGWPTEDGPTSSTSDDSNVTNSLNAKKAEQPKQSSVLTSKTPERVFAMVDPQIDGKPAIYELMDAGFIGRLRVDLEGFLKQN